MTIVLYGQYLHRHRWTRLRNGGAECCSPIVSRRCLINQTGGNRVEINQRVRFITQTHLTNEWTEIYTFGMVEQKALRLTLFFCTHMTPTVVNFDLQRWLRVLERPLSRSGPQTAKQLNPRALHIMVSWVEQLQLLLTRNKRLKLQKKASLLGEMLLPVAMFLVFAVLVYISANGLFSSFLLCPRCSFIWSRTVFNRLKTSRNNKTTPPIHLLWAWFRPRQRFQLLCPSRYSTLAPPSGRSTTMYKCSLRIDTAPFLLPKAFLCFLFQAIMSKIRTRFQNSGVNASIVGCDSEDQLVQAYQATPWPAQLYFYVRNR